MFLFFSHIDLSFSNAQEMNTDLIKEEPKEEDQSGQDTDAAEEDFENCSTSHQVRTNLLTYEFLKTVDVY